MMQIVSEQNYICTMMHHFEEKYEGKKKKNTEIKEAILKSHVV